MLKYGLGKLRRGFLCGIVIGYTTQRAESSEINQNMCFRESPYGGRVGGWGVFSEFNGIRVRYQEFYGIVTYGITGILRRIIAIPIS